MSYLDRSEIIKKYDPGKMLESLDAFPDQINQAWTESRKFKVPVNYKAINSVVIAGMGGSAWPWKIIQALYDQVIKIPFRVISDYRVPGNVDSKTLFIGSSYSGSTEEPVQAVRTAKKIGAKVAIIASGKNMVSLARAWKVPAYLFQARYNPSGQPRLGTGYMMFGALGMLSRFGVVSLTNQQVNKVVRIARTGGKKWSLNIPLKKNKTKQLALRLVNSIPMIISAEHLLGTSEAFRNRLNENSKHWSIAYPIPDLNHHLLEGLGNPAAAKRLMAVYLESKLYDKRNQKRFQVTQSVMKKYKIPAYSFRPNGSNKLEEVIISLSFSGYVSFWLAMLHKINPTPIPWVDYFKYQLKK